MKTLDFNTALQMAAELPQDAGTPVYQLFEESNTTFTTIYACDPVSVYSSIIGFQKNNKTYYLSFLNGKSVLMYHKKYARIDVQVSTVEFDICGLKRKSTHLPAGVLVKNIKFVI